MKPGADIKQLISSGEKDPIETITNLVINIATIKCDTPEETLTNSETKIVIVIYFSFHKSVQI